MTRESELAGLAGRFPRLGSVEGCQRPVLRPARRGTQDEPVRGEDITDLADQIARAEAFAANSQLLRDGVPLATAGGALAL